MKSATFRKILVQRIDYNMRLRLPSYTKIHQYCTLSSIVHVRNIDDYYLYLLMNFSTKNKSFNAELGWSLCYTNPWHLPINIISPYEIKSFTGERFGISMLWSHNQYQWKVVTPEDELLNIKHTGNEIFNMVMKLDYSDLDKIGMFRLSPEQKKNYIKSHYSQSEYSDDECSVYPVVDIFYDRIISHITKYTQHLIENHGLSKSPHGAILPSDRQV